MVTASVEDSVSQALRCSSSDPTSRKVSCPQQHCSRENLKPPPWTVKTTVEYYTGKNRVRKAFQVGSCHQGTESENGGTKREVHCGVLSGRAHETLVTLAASTSDSTLSQYS